MNLKRDTTAILGPCNPALYYSPLQIIEQTDFHTFVKGLTKDCLQKLKNNIGCIVIDSMLRHVLLMTPPFSRTCTVKLWNKLPAEIVSASFLSVFKIDIRGYLSKTYDVCLFFWLVPLKLFCYWYSHAKLS